MKRSLPALLILSSAIRAQPATPYPQGIPPAPTYSVQELDQLVAPYALYPDPLLAQLLTASTFSNEIPDADGWARSHAYLTGDALARAIQDDNLQWDPSVIALLPTPAVLDMMAGDMGRTEELGDAVLVNRATVMDAIQDQRQKAFNYGYLRSNAQDRVVTAGPGDIEILPANPNVVCIPYYDPNVVYFRPAPGFFIGGAITFGPGIYVGAFLPWGWDATFAWKAHNIIIAGRPWERTWMNPGYIHPYPMRPRVTPGPRIERHELREYRPAPRGVRR